MACDARNPGNPDQLRDDAGAVLVSGCAPSPLGSGNTTVSARTVDLLHAGDAQRLEARDDFADEHLRRRRAGRDADTQLALDPFGAELVGAVDHVRGNASVRGDFAQPIGIGAVRAADDDHHVDPRRDELHGILPVLRRVADVVLLRPDDLRKALAAAQRRSRAASSTDRVVCVTYARLTGSRHVAGARTSSTVSTR